MKSHLILIKYSRSKKMKSSIIILLILLIMANANAEPIANDYGYVNAWFNGEEGTVKNVKLKIGEPSEIKVTVTSNISGNVYVKLTNPLVTESFRVIDGPSEIGKTIPNSGVPAGWSKTYTWMVEPTGDWTNGNAPINILISFSNKGDQKPIEFTIANPYILDEQYQGTVPTQTTEPAGTEGAESSPFPSAIIALMVLVCAWRRL